MFTQKTIRSISLVAIIALAGCSGTSDVPQNNFLSADTYGMTHFDPAQSDTFPYAVTTGIHNIDLAQQKHVTNGPINIMTLASTDSDYMWNVGTQGVTYVKVSDGDFSEVARYDVNKKITAEMHDKALHRDIKTAENADYAVKKIYGVDETRIFNGIYSVIDQDNIAYVNYGKKIYAFELVDKSKPGKGIAAAKTLDLTDTLDKNERIVGVSITYDGMLTIAGNRKLMIVDRKFETQPQVIRFAKDEFITNSMAIDERGGIYIASDKNMYKIIWNGKTLSRDEKDGAWTAPYSFGEQPPAVKIGKGTGATPTLMGFGSDEDKLVVITDGVNRMNIVAFWRDEIPEDFIQKSGTKSRRIADQTPVLAGLSPKTKWIQTEQSVVVHGYGAFVVNNVVNKAPADRMVGVVALGPAITPPMGVEKFVWNTEKNMFESQWTRGDVSSISMVPALSIDGNMVLVNGYYKASGWEVTGLDWNTGKTMNRTIFGHDNFGNGAYAIIQSFKNGDLLFNSIAGPFRVKYAK